MSGEHHHPGEQEDDVQVDRGERFLLIDDPEDDDERRHRASAATVLSTRSVAMSAYVMRKMTPASATSTRPP